jgi:hypothetical protein
MIDAAYDDTEADDAYAARLRLPPGAKGGDTVLCL